MRRVVHFNGEKGGPPGANYTEILNSTEQCGGYVDDLADDAFNWNSTITGVATLPTKVLHTVATGSANGNATLYLQADGPHGYVRRGISIRRNR